MIEYLQHIDTSIFLFLNGMHASWCDVLFYWISNRFVWIPLYLFLGYLIIKQYGKRCWIPFILIVTIIILSDQSCNLIKKTVQRPRPSHNTELVEEIHLVAKPDGTLYKGGPYGFPSSHAANSMALAMFVAFVLKHKQKWPLILMFAWVLLISYSRIYLGVHYPGDIVVGWCLGVAFGMAGKPFKELKIEN